MFDFVGRAYGVAPHFRERIVRIPEVEDVFEVPLDHFLDERNHRIDSRVWQGRERREQWMLAVMSGTLSTVAVTSRMP